MALLQQHSINSSVQDERKNGLIHDENNNFRGDNLIQDNISSLAKKNSSTLYNPSVSKVSISECGEYVVLGRQKFKAGDLQTAFGGTLNPGLMPYKNVQINPAPLGLSAFAITTFLLSLFNIRVFQIEVPNMMIGLACMYGGAVQMFCGAWEGYTGNTFGFIALSSYGAFWLSFSAIYLEAFGIAAAYEDKVEFGNAVGFFLLGWTLFTLMLVLTTMKSTLAFFSLFFFLFITYIFLCVGAFTGNNKWDRVGGIFGMVTATLAWYNAWAGVATKQNAYFTSKVIPLKKISFK